MKKLILATIAIFFFWLPKSLLAYQAAGSAMLKNEVLGLPQADPRFFKLTGFLNQYHSPMAPYAGFLIAIADDCQIDWRLVSAIAGVESTFGKKIPLNSYNAYGWNNGLFRFNSWEEGMAIVTRALAEKYVAKGLNTPPKIGPVYAPPSKTWAAKVTYFMDKIEDYKTESFLTL